MHERHSLFQVGNLGLCKVNEPWLWHWSGGEGIGNQEGERERQTEREGERSTAELHSFFRLMLSQPSLVLPLRFLFSGFQVFVSQGPCSSWGRQRFS